MLDLLVLAIHAFFIIISSSSSNGFVYIYLCYILADNFRMVLFLVKVVSL